MALTKIQSLANSILKQGKSLILVAPTGIGKTRAVLADLEPESDTRIIYGVPLRALAGGIAAEAQTLQKDLVVAIHHGASQQSNLFSEQLIVTTFDQVVCATPGLPLSLPLAAGHAIAGALLLSRLVLDEAHLAWSISGEALAILFAIVRFRQRLGRQTVIMTATLPVAVAKHLAAELGMELLVAGEDQSTEDEGLIKREQNRILRISIEESKRAGTEKDEALSTIVKALSDCETNCIYFANTVERLHRVYDQLESAGIDMRQVTVLHNRMPQDWRTEREAKVRREFGKSASGPKSVLLTNQVAEAGLDISANLVISDPAPVDTLIQRAGRCARWFREHPVQGEFRVISPPKVKLKEWAIPYQEKSVSEAIDALKTQILKGERDTCLGWELEKNGSMRPGLG